jgi:hypothetical protein
VEVRLELRLQGHALVQRFKKRLARGEYFPPFLYISIINSCNLRCQGCWVKVDGPREMIPGRQARSADRRCQEAGQQLLRHPRRRAVHAPELLTVLERHPDCYFQIFTNGQLITDAIAAKLRALGNATPLVSIEGTEVVSDERRGQAKVLTRTLAGLDACIRHKLITGVATSVCQTNIDDLLQESWLRALIERGVTYAWYHTYRPVGANQSPGAGADPGAGAAGAALRRRDAHEAAARPDRRLLGRPGPGAVPDGHRHQPPHQPVGRHRAVPDHPVLEGERLRRARPLRRLQRLGLHPRLPRAGGADDARLHRAGAAGPGEGAGREARAATRRTAKPAPGWPSWAP